MANRAQRRAAGTSVISGAKPGGKPSQGHMVAAFTSTFRLLADTLIKQGVGTLEGEEMVLPAHLVSPLIRATAELVTGMDVTGILALGSHGERTFDSLVEEERERQLIEGDPREDLSPSIPAPDPEPEDEDGFPHPGGHWTDGLTENDVNPDMGAH